MHLSRYRRFVGLDVRNLFQQDVWSGQEWRRTAVVKPRDHVRKRSTWFSCTRDIMFVDLQGDLFSRFLHSSSVAILTEVIHVVPGSPSETLPAVSI
ncbi:hypothetical protein M407DRAFT_246684 [Tulasnella calospora MUT 4182]|uniref:Uncharacterized protein n=1 Tax=Tulasnella calospora MUT 4182 TaxID=1051891 RepID=A0A0C3K8B2_9AGAM|nr:hypothetical protein M407DRAFT_246684 [Tulasnella calospora MUT 4182]